MKHPLTQLDGCINTASGLKLDLLNPEPSQINIRDISKGLSNKGHFAGQTPKFFSIAEHSLLVDTLYNYDCLLNNREYDPIMGLACLLHDASEAYIGDMIKPLKVQPGMEFFVHVEVKLMSVIFEALSSESGSLMGNVKPYDKLAQKIEYDAFYNGDENSSINYYSPNQSDYLFMGRYHSLLTLISHGK